MNVAVVTNQAFFVRGGAELLGDALVTAIRRAGHRAELVRVPLLHDSPRAVLASLVAARAVRLGNVDHVVALKFPGYAVAHESRVVWLLHQFRQAYDLWDPATHGRDPDWVGAREAIQAADAEALASARAVYTNSRVTAERLSRFNGIPSEVLLPPPLRPPPAPGPYGDYLFMGGRISDCKRQALAVAALAQTARPVRLTIAGPPDDAAALRRVEEEIARHRLDDRVRLEARWLSEEERDALVAGARGCVSIPVDEDSFAYVTLEACLAARPVVTCTDSGGTLQLVDGGVTGLVCAPEPAELAAAFDVLDGDADRARALGEAARDRALGLALDWDHVVARLVA
jgi:glycosyltransferase involved in cell wall biosynthesis